MTLVSKLERPQWQFLTSYGLKWIAILTMLVDHAAAIVVYEQYLTVFRGQGASAAADWYTIYLAMRYIGRIAFPLFCFMLAEGFAHTHSRPKYALRLLLFAVIAEWPYDFSLYSTGLEFKDHQSVMCTLLLGFLALWAGDALGNAIDSLLARLRGSRDTTRDRFQTPAERTTSAPVIPARGIFAHPSSVLLVNQEAKLLSPAVIACTVVFIAAGAWVADVTEMCYHAFGILLIGALYIGRRYPLVQFALGCACVAWYCAMHSSMFESYAVIGLLLTLLYNGKLGGSKSGNKAMKWFFYAFYPAHLLLLAGLKYLLF